MNDILIGEVWLCSGQSNMEMAVHGWGSVSYTHLSMQFATYIEKKTHTVSKRLIFAIGGPYGFSEAVYQKANEKLTLSRMTFSHQMVRLIFVEQLYRAMTILNNEPYNHE